MCYYVACRWETRSRSSAWWFTRAMRQRFKWTQWRASTSFQRWWTWRMKRSFTFSCCRYSFHCQVRSCVPPGLSTTSRSNIWASTRVQRQSKTWPTPSWLWQAVGFWSFAILCLFPSSSLLKWSSFSRAALWTWMSKCMMKTKISIAGLRALWSMKSLAKSSISFQTKLAL